MQFLRNVSLCLMVVLLSSCSGGGSSSQQDAMLGKVTIATSATGPTPFIAHIGIDIERADLVRSVSYTITPKPGTVSRPVSIAYNHAYLVRRQLLDVVNRHLDLPVVGLYAGYQNKVSLHLTFADGSVRSDNAVSDTPAYQEAAPIYTAWNVKTPRQSPYGDGRADRDAYRARGMGGGLQSGVREYLRCSGRNWRPRRRVDRQRD